MCEVSTTQKNEGSTRSRKSLMQRMSSSKRPQNQKSYSARGRQLQRSYQSMAKIQPLEINHRHFHLEWWHAIFIFSCVSLLVCMLQIFLPPPFGLRMTSSEVADLGIAPDGCQDGLEQCICPRDTICATDKLSMALLVLARCSVFFDYPLYGMMFLSKTQNINNILRRTLLREWIDFADMHRVHKLFGIVIGVETVFHSLLHLVRLTVMSLLLRSRLIE